MKKRILYSYKFKMYSYFSIYLVWKNHKIIFSPTREWWVTPKCGLESKILQPIFHILHSTNVSAILSKLTRVLCLWFFFSLCWYKLTVNSQLKLNSCLSICLTIFRVRDNVAWLLSHILKETKYLTKIIWDKWVIFMINFYWKIKTALHNFFITSTFLKPQNRDSV